MAAIYFLLAILAACSVNVVESGRNRPSIHPSRIVTLPVNNRPIKHRNFTLGDFRGSKAALDHFTTLQKEFPQWASKAFIEPVGPSGGLQRKALADKCDGKPIVLDDQDVYAKALGMDNLVIDFASKSAPVFYSDFIESFFLPSIWTFTNDLKYLAVNQTLAIKINRGTAANPSLFEAANYAFGRALGLAVGTNNDLKLDATHVDPRATFSNNGKPLPLTVTPTIFISLVRGIFKQAAPQFRFTGTVGVDFNYNFNAGTQQYQVLVCADKVVLDRNVDFKGHSAGAGSSFAINQALQATSVTNDNGNLRFGSEFRIPNNGANIKLVNLGSSFFDVTYKSSIVGFVNVFNLNLDGTPLKDSKFVFVPSSSADSVEFFTNYYIRGGISVPVTVAGRSDVTGAGSTEATLANGAFRDFNFATNVNGPVKNFKFVAQLEAIGDANKAHIFRIQLANPSDVSVVFQKISFDVTQTNADGSKTVIASGSSSFNSGSVAPGTSNVPVPEITLTSANNDATNIEKLFRNVFTWTPSADFKTGSFNTNLKVSFTNIRISASFAGSSLVQDFLPLDVTDVPIIPTCRSGRCKLDTKIFVAGAAIAGTVDDTKLGAVTFTNPTLRPITIQKFGFTLKVSGGATIAKGTIDYTAAPLQLGASQAALSSGDITLQQTADFTASYNQALSFKSDTKTFDKVIVDIVDQTFFGQSIVSATDSWTDVDWTPVIATKLQWVLDCRTGSCKLDPLTFINGVTLPGIFQTAKIADLGFVNPSEVSIDVSGFTFDLVSNGAVIGKGSNAAAFKLPLDTANPKTTAIPILNLNVADNNGLAAFLADQYTFIPATSSFPPKKISISNLKFTASSAAWSAGKQFTFLSQGVQDLTVKVDCRTGKCVLDQVKIVSKLDAIGRDFEDEKKRVVRLFLKSFVPTVDLTIKGLSFDIVSGAATIASGVYTSTAGVALGRDGVEVRLDQDVELTYPNDNPNNYEKFFAALYKRDATGKFPTDVTATIANVKVTAGTAKEVKTDAAGTVTTTVWNTVSNWIPLDSVNVPAPPNCVGGICKSDTSSPFVTDVSVAGTDDVNKLASFKIKNIFDFRIQINSVKFDIVDANGNTLANVAKSGLSIIVPSGAVQAIADAAITIQDSLFNDALTTLYTVDSTLTPPGFKPLPATFTYANVVYGYRNGLFIIPKQSTPLDSLNVPILPDCRSGKCVLETKPFATGITLIGSDADPKRAVLTFLNPTNVAVKFSQITFDLVSGGNVIAKGAGATAITVAAFGAATADVEIPLTVKPEFDSLYQALFSVPKGTNIPKVTIANVQVSRDTPAYTFVAQPSAAVDAGAKCKDGKCLLENQALVSSLVIPGIADTNKIATIGLASTVNTAIAVKSITFDLARADGTGALVAIAKGTSAFTADVVVPATAVDVGLAAIAGQETAFAKLLADLYTPNADHVTFSAIKGISIQNIQVNALVGTGATPYTFAPLKSTLDAQPNCISGDCKTNLLPRSTAEATSIESTDAGINVAIGLTNPEIYPLDVTGASFTASVTQTSLLPRRRNAKRADIVVSFKGTFAVPKTIAPKSSAAVSLGDITLDPSTSDADKALFYNSVFAAPVNGAYPDVNIQLSKITIEAVKGTQDKEKVTFVAKDKEFKVPCKCIGGDCKAKILPTTVGGSTLAPTATAAP
ncbi:hypothetical protein HDU97_004035 [Phlyctochytrium planicorne]|nr:hypothetical protein HDU97_004035 [Phlyctochytrium planicorne]